MTYRELGVYLVGTYCIEAEDVKAGADGVKRLVTEVIYYDGTITPDVRGVFGYEVRFVSTAHPTCTVYLSSPDAFDMRLREERS